MTVKQISVFVENKPNSMSKFTDVLSANNIDMRALSLAEAADFGVVRVIVDDVYNAMQVIKDAGYICSATKVLAVAIPDEPGGLNSVLAVLSEAQINVEYMYAFAGKNDGKAIMIIQAEDLEAAEGILQRGGFQQAEIEGI